MDHPEIPTGDYCYKLQGIARSPAGLPKLQTKICPHLKSASGEIRCALLEGRGETASDILLDDQVKICGINPGNDIATETI
jgi:hypothetical protein